MAKTLSVRLDDTQLAKLETLATFDGVALAEEIREAIDLLLEARKGDPEFRERVRSSFDRARTLLTELGGGDEIAAALGDPLEAGEAREQPGLAQAG